jgi:hypothetical protein
MKAQGGSGKDEWLGGNGLGREATYRCDGDVRTAAWEKARSRPRTRF